MKIIVNVTQSIVIVKNYMENVTVMLRALCKYIYTLW